MFCKHLCTYYCGMMSLAVLCCLVDTTENSDLGNVCNEWPGDSHTCGGGEGALGGCAAAGGAGRDGGRDGLLSDRPLICRDSAAFSRAANWSCEMFTSPRYM